MSKLKLRFVPSDDTSKELLTSNGIKHLLDLTLKSTKSWVSVAEYLFTKWESIPNISSRLCIFYKDKHDNLSNNFIQSNENVLISLKDHPVIEMNQPIGDVLTVPIFYTISPSSSSTSSSTVRNSLLSYVVDSNQHNITNNFTENKLEFVMKDEEYKPPYEDSLLNAINDFTNFAKPNSETTKGPVTPMVHRPTLVPSSLTNFVEGISESLFGPFATNEIMQLPKEKTNQQQLSQFAQSYPFPSHLSQSSSMSSQPNRELYSYIQNTQSIQSFNRKLADGILTFSNDEPISQPKFNSPDHLLKPESNIKSISSPTTITVPISDNEKDASLSSLQKNITDITNEKSQNIQESQDHLKSPIHSPKKRKFSETSPSVIFSPKSHTFVETSTVLRVLKQGEVIPQPEIKNEIIINNLPTNIIIMKRFKSTFSRVGRSRPELRRITPTLISELPNK